MLKTKLYTSKGVLTSGWIHLAPHLTSQYGHTFQNDPYGNMMRIDFNPIYSGMVAPLIVAALIVGVVFSFIVPSSGELFAFYDFLLIMILGPIVYMRGFKNRRMPTLICFAVSLILAMMVVISENNLDYLFLGTYFLVMIYVEIMICSGGMLFKG